MKGSWDTECLRREAKALRRVGNEHTIDTPYGEAEPMVYGLCAEGLELAADEIERLEAEVERLENAIEVMGSTQERYREALREIYEASGDDDDEKSQHYDWIKDTAKQALKDDSDG